MCPTESLVTRGVIDRCRIRKGIFNRWILVHPDSDDLAWTGSRWAPHASGLPAGLVQVCNFDTRAQAVIYAEESGFEVLD